MKMSHLLFFTVFLISNTVFAAQIDKVKGKKTLIRLDGLSVSVGDMVEAFDPSTEKRTAILKITKVKNDKAVAQMVRGRVAADFEIKLKGSSSNSEDEENPSEMPTSRKKKSSSSSASTSTFAVGGLFGIGMDSMDIKIGSPIEEVAQSGMGFSLMGALDYKLASWFSFRGLVGVEQFNVDGESQLPTTTICDTCETKLTYFSVMGWGRLLVTDSIWAGVGLGLQHPLTDESNALDPQFIGTTAVYAIGMGMDFDLSDTMYLPIQFEYGMQPSSDSVSVSYYGVRAGIMLRY